MEDSGKVVGRWIYSDGVLATIPKVDQFLDEVVDLCKRHGFSITHEDDHGAFIICLIMKITQNG